MAYLASRPGETVSKEELFENIWAKYAVTDDSLTQCIADIRRALKDADRSILQTRPKKGYCLNVTILHQGTGHHKTRPETKSIQTRRRGLIGALLVVALGFGIAWFVVLDRQQAGSISADLPLPANPSIAVLAFEEHSTGEDAGYLSDAIAEGIITDLSRFPELFVIARNSSFSFRNTPTKVHEISKTLGVRYLIDGSQQKSGDQLRVTVCPSSEFFGDLRLYRNGGSGSISV